MDPARSRNRAGRGRIVAASILAAVLLVLAAFSIGRLSAPDEGTPGTRSNEAGFARDMQVHHAQAVELSFIVRDETDDEEVRLMALDIASGQANQAGQMYGWLDSWNLPQAESEPSMTWMTRPTLAGENDHNHGSSTSAHTPGDSMPGYATAEQIAKLKTLTGEDAAKYYLELMIAHHRGGVEMAQAILDRSTMRVVTTLATNIVTSQSSEITAMQDMLAARS